LTQQHILDSLWVEKFRPPSIAAMALDAGYRSILSGYITDGIFPHLLFEGPPGSGKTTIAQILISSVNCAALKLNASDERGIDVVRGKIKNFAQVATLKRFKVVFLDEADKITGDGQDALKNIMETYSSVCRFILTCNNVNLISDPIKSRCSAGTFHFNAIPRFEITAILEDILKKEKIEYVLDDLNKHVLLHYPDLRKSISTMQMNICSGKFTYIDDTEVFKQLADLLLAKDLKGIRTILARKHSIDFVDLYRYFYDNVSMFERTIRLQVLLDIAEYLFRDGSMPDKEINFVGFCVKVMPLIRLEK